MICTFVGIGQKLSISLLFEEASPGVVAPTDDFDASERLEFLTHNVNRTKSLQNLFPLTKEVNLVAKIEHNAEKWTKCHKRDK